MIYKNRDNIPGILDGSYEFVHTPTSTAKDIYLHIEYIGHQFVNRYYYCSRSSYAHYLLFYIISGKAVVFSESRDYIMEPGQAFLIETARPHIYGALENTETIWVHFNGRHFADFFEHLKAINGGHVFFIKNQMDFTDRFFALLRDQQAQNPQPEIVVSARLYELMALLVTEPPGADETPVNLAINYINRHYYEKLSIDTLARHVSMSVSRLSSLFKTETGYSPYHYIINTRLHAAYQRLIARRDSVEQIALDCGFNNASAFIFSFRKKYGITPSQFRKSMEGEVIR
jgi:AraC-like DNA-binding protein